MQFFWHQFLESFPCSVSSFLLTHSRSLHQSRRQRTLSAHLIRFEAIAAGKMSTSDSLKLTTAIAALPGHTDRAWKLSWSPAEPLLASCSSDKSIRLYSYSSPPPSSSSTSAETIIASPTFTHTSTIPTSHSRTVRSLAFSPTGTTLATASFDSTVGIWQRINENGVEDDDAGNTLGGGEWEALDPLEGHESECKSVEWSYDGRLVASCSRDKSVWIWEGASTSRFHYA